MGEQKMNIREIKEIKEIEFKDTIDWLTKFEFLGDIDFISHCSGSTIFTTHIVDLEGARREIRKACGQNETLQHYYVSHVPAELAVVYSYGDFDVVFFTALDYLDKISGGKCEIKEREITEKTLYVECEI